MKWKLKDLTVDGKGSYGIGAPAIPYQEDKLTYSSFGFRFQAV